MTFLSCLNGFDVSFQGMFSLSKHGINNNRICRTGTDCLEQSDSQTEQGQILAYLGQIGLWSTLKQFPTTSLSVSIQNNRNTTKLVKSTKINNIAYSIIFLLQIFFLECDLLFLAFYLFLLPSMTDLYNFVMVDLSESNTSVQMFHEIQECKRIIQSPAFGCYFLPLIYQK